MYDRHIVCLELSNDRVFTFKKFSHQCRKLGLYCCYARNVGVNIDWQYRKQTQMGMNSKHFIKVAYSISQYCLMKTIYGQRPCMCPQCSISNQISCELSCIETIMWMDIGDEGMRCGLYQRLWNVNPWDFPKLWYIDVARKSHCTLEWRPRFTSYIREEV